MKVELKKTFQFEAAHSLPRLPEDHKCFRLHGHSFRTTLHISGECDEELGWLLDYSEISDAFQPLWKQLDHHHLNEIDGLETHQRKHRALDLGTAQTRVALLQSVEVAETCNAGAFIGANTTSARPPRYAHVNIRPRLAATLRLLRTGIRLRTVEQ